MKKNSLGNIGKPEHFMINQIEHVVYMYTRSLCVYIHDKHDMWSSAKAFSIFTVIFPFV